jgi:hypothetical protein
MCKAMLTAQTRLEVAARAAGLAPEQAGEG